LADASVEDRSCQVDHPIRVVVGRALLTPLMRAVIVEVRLVTGQHRAQMSDTEDERQVQALSTQAPDEPLRVAVRPRRPDRRLDRPGTDRSEHSVERCGELRIPIADQELELVSALPEVD